MRSRIIRTLVIAAFAGGATVMAQTPAAAPLARRFLDPSNGLSLAQAIAAALEREPSLRAARSEVDVAQGQREQASLRPNPSVSVERRIEPGGTDDLTSFAVQWPLDLFRKGSRVAVADGEVATARFAVADRERLLSSEVRARNGEVLAAVRDLALLDEIAAATRRQYELLQARAAEGASPPLERDLTDVELRRLEAERLLQAGRAEAALLALKRAIGMTPDVPLTVRETLEDLVHREAAAAAPPIRDAAVDERADVREAASRVDTAAAKIDRARDAGGLDVSVFGNLMRMDAGFPQRGFGPDGSLQRVRGLFNYFSLGAMITLPLNHNQGDAAAARAEQSGAVMVHEAARLTARTEIETARVRDDYARQAVRVYSDGAEALARQNLAVVTQSYELGRLTVFDVLAERRRYLDVERAYTDALRAAFEARTALLVAMGERK
jgi:cobalt-zinc-cadmium efflux system outer membrane protein